MSEKKVEIKLFESDAKLLKRFLGMTKFEDIENMCKKYGIESEACEVDEIFYGVYNQLHREL